MVRQYLSVRDGAPTDRGCAVSVDEVSSEEDDAVEEPLPAPEEDVDEDSIPTPEDEVDDDSTVVEVDEFTVRTGDDEGPTIGVPLYASAPGCTGKRDHEDDGYPLFLKKARIGGGTLEFIVDPDYDRDKNKSPSGFDVMDLPLFKDLPFKRSQIAFEQDQLPVGCDDWDMSFNVAMWYVDCPLCLGYVVCDTCGQFV